MPHVIPSRVKTIREALDKPLADISKKASLSERNLLRIERDHNERRSVNENTLRKLAQALRVDVEVLTGDLPMPENLADRAHNASQKLEPPEPPKEIFETRLVKLDDEYVIVEFSDMHPTGRVIARQIVDEAAGLRLSSASDLRVKLSEIYRMMTHPDGFFEGFCWELMNANYLAELEPEDQLDAYAAQLGRLLDESPPNRGKLLLTDAFNKLEMNKKEDSNEAEDIAKDTVIPQDSSS
jgi:transcriptional regulator with XRE-family HTH domain